MVLTNGLLISTLGRPCVGKTTMALRLSQYFHLDYISVGAFKRSLRPNYTTRDSLDEKLRDDAYQLSLERVKKNALTQSTSVIDASFHRRFRRQWLYSCITEVKASLVMIHCTCDDKSEIHKRIQERSQSLGNALENEIDFLDIFRFIDSAFEEVLQEELPSSLPFAVIHIDTFSNQITNLDISNNFKLHQDLNIIQEFLNGYLEDFKHESH